MPRRSRSSSLVPDPLGLSLVAPKKKGGAAVQESPPAPKAKAKAKAKPKPKVKARKSLFSTSGAQILKGAGYYVSWFCGAGSAYR